MRIEDVTRAIKNGRVWITDHADEEAHNNGLSFEEIYFSTIRGEIIEEYPTDRPYPSCLVYGDTFAGEPVHSVWSYNGQTGFAVLITVYRPSPDLWAADWKTRR